MASPPERRKLLDRIVRLRERIPIGLRRATKDNYARAFDTFRTASDVVQVEAEALTDEVRNRGARSLCDIGAGPGDLAQHLAAAVETYVAVESRPDYAAALGRLGFRVIDRQWPAPVPQQFDAVVMAHVLRSRGDLSAMVDAAIDTLTTDGVLLVVLHAIEGSEWQRLMHRIEMPDQLQDDLREDVASVLAERGLVVRRRDLRTRVSTDTAKATIRALSFVASAGDPDVAEEFVRRLERLRFVDWGHQGRDGSYAFDFALLLLAAERPSSLRDAHWPHERPEVTTATSPGPEARAARDDDPSLA